MNRTFERVRSEPSPDLWPEIARRLDEPPRRGTSRRGRQALSVIVSVALVAGALVWALSALRLESRPSARSLAPGAVVRIPAGHAPQSIAADDSGVWVVSGTTENGNVLWRIDPRTNRGTELPQTRGAGWPAVGEGFAWVTCTGAGNPCGGDSILKLDPATGQTLAAIRLPGDAFQIATGLGNVWVSSSVGLLKIDPLASAVVATFPVRTISLGAADGFGWATTAGYGGVVQIDPKNGRVVSKVGFHDPCEFLVTNGGVWVASCQGGLRPGRPGDTLMRIDPATGRASYVVPLERLGGSLALSHGQLWLSRWVGNHVEVEARDPATGQPTGTVLRVRPGPRQWIQLGFGQPVVFSSAGAGSFWLTHVDANDVVRLGIGG